jgi:HK97 family phage major capsid protein
MTDPIADLPPARLPFPVTRMTPDPVELRAEGDAKPRLVGRFTTFDDPYEVRSSIEGHFIERMAPGAFDRTVVESRKNIKVLFNHGQDPTMGQQQLGAIEDLRGSADFAVDPFDGIPPLLRSGLEAGAYGSSHRFSVISDEWDHKPARSDWNPDGIPVRTITEARLYEFGPVTFPANPNATAGIRSTTDDYYQRSTDASAYETVMRSAQVARTPAPVEVPAAPEGSPQTDTGLPPSPEPDAQRTVDPQPTTPLEYDTVTEYISRDEKAARAAELAAIITRQATEYPGVMAADVQADYDANKAERTKLLADIEAWDARQKDIAALGATERNVESTFAAPAVIRSKSVEDIYDVRSIDTSAHTPEDRAAKLRDNAMRSIDASYLPKSSNVDELAKFLDREQGDADQDGRLHQEATRRILLTGSPQYKRAFAKYLKDGNDRGFTPEENRAAALAVTGTTTTGGYAVPYVFDPTFIHIGAHTSVNPYRAACRVETISGGNNWRAVTATAITAKWDTEAAASVEGGPTIGQPTFTVQRADAFATVSIETLQDRPDVTEELSSLFAEAKDTLEENSFTLGVGTTVYPQGMFLSGAFTVVSTATDNTTVIADTLLLEAALPLRHRANAAWFMSRSTQRQLEALDTTGYYFKRPGQLFSMGKTNPSNASAVGNTGTELLGYPIWEVPSAVSTLTTDAAVIAVLADPKNYVVVDRIGLSVEVVPTMLNGATPSFPTGQRGIYAYWRSTARVLNADGGRQLDVN